MFKVMFKKSAIKGMKKMPMKLRQKMQDEIETIAKDPAKYSGNWKPLTGSDYWRLRVGGYRAICNIQEDVLMLLVIKVGPRGDIYK